MSTSAERQRRLRERRRQGRGVLPIECNHTAVADWLVAKGFLAAWDADDPARIAQALSHAVHVWSDSDE